jgi:hypothetical protein
VIPAQRQQRLKARKVGENLEALFMKAGIFVKAGPPIGHASRYKYAHCAASHFLQSINQCAVAIWCRGLQDLKKRRTSE